MVVYLRIIEDFRNIVHSSVYASNARVLVVRSELSCRARLQEQQQGQQPQEAAVRERLHRKRSIISSQTRPLAMRDYNKPQPRSGSQAPPKRGMPISATSGVARTWVTPGPSSWSLPVERRAARSARAKRGKIFRLHFSVIRMGSRGTLVLCTDVRGSR